MKLARETSGSPRGTHESEARHNGEPPHSKAMDNNHLQNSRGGTRTRDPGIMSAVL